MAQAEVDADSTAVLTRERIALNIGAALLVAGLLLVFAVLPAEYGIDLLGVGRLLGLTAMSDVQKDLDTFQAGRVAAGGGAPTVAPQEHGYRNETIAFTLEPRGFIEYKYRLNKGAALLYSWSATGPVNYELHAEPDGAPRGYAESFEKGNEAAAASGTLTAPFSGIHGWYWENSSDREATVTLSAAGFYSMSYEFRKDAEPKTRMFP